MKILNAQQIREADEFTIAQQQMTSDELMERAATAVFNWLHNRLNQGKIQIHLFCGVGNNGGDGLALARHLIEHDYSVKVYVINYSEKRSKDFLKNLDRLKDRKLWPTVLDERSEYPEVGPNELVVDAIFGTGLNREIKGWPKKLIQYINKQQAFTLSIDVPSGLFLERMPKSKEAVVEANHTLSFQVPKLIFFLPDTASFVGQWDLLDIGLDAHFLGQVQNCYELMGKYEVLPMYRGRYKFAHKGDFGHALLVGGSYGKMGAIMLASKACIKVGSGLVSSLLPSSGYVPMQSANPEIMVITNETPHFLDSIDFTLKPDVIGLGMGMGTHESTIVAMERFLSSNRTPLVLDADAINILAQRPDLLAYLPDETILTPHLGELERLIGPWADDFEKLEKVKVFSQKHNCIVVVKGAHTVVVQGAHGYINSTGNPGMATAGSGDVLAGMINGLRAQGYAALDAAIFGVYLHGLAADLAMPLTGYEALTASTMIDYIGPAFLELFKRPKDEE